VKTRAWKRSYKSHTYITPCIKAVLHISKEAIQVLNRSQPVWWEEKKGRKRHSLRRVVDGQTCQRTCRKNQLVVISIGKQVVQGVLAIDIDASFRLLSEDCTTKRIQNRERCLTYVAFWPPVCFGSPWSKGQEKKRATRRPLDENLYSEDKHYYQTVLFVRSSKHAWVKRDQTSFNGLPQTPLSPTKREIFQQ